MGRFLATFEVTERTRILDVGGTPETWADVPVKPRVTLLNMPRAGVARVQGFDCVGADGCLLPFRDGAFDIVFSNSVIEHVGDGARQERFALECRRAGRGYWIQTPNFWYPIEPHLLTPLVHFLPRRVQRAVISRGSVWQWLERPTEDRREFYVEHYLRDIRLLDAERLKKLFPDATVILRERSTGFTKSLIAVRSR